MCSRSVLTGCLLVLVLSSVGCSKLEAESNAAALATARAVVVASSARTVATTPRAVPGPTPAATPTAAAAAVVAAPSGSLLSETAHEIERSCRSICVRSAALHCGPNTECEKDCVVAAAATPCTAAFLRLYACLEREPLSRWECTDGAAAIREGFCDEQQSDAARCVEAIPRP